MAKLMYDPTEERKKKKANAKQVQREVKAKKEVSVEQPKAEKTEKTEKPKASGLEKEPEKPLRSEAKAEKIVKSPTEEQVLAAMEKDVGYTSTVLKDKLGLDKEMGRDQIRRIMRKLEDGGKVTVTPKSNGGKRKQFVYKLK